MSPGLGALHWNRTKLVYDAILGACVLIYIVVFMAAGRWWLSPPDDPATWEMLRIRAFGTCAFVMLTVVLAIGPLARLNRRFLPLLYNRRHFGVLTFCVAAVHGWLNIEYFVSRGQWQLLVDFVTTPANYATVEHFPYDTFGILALLVMFLMAATSHDFWLHRLSPPAWKALHMAVYVAYAMLVLHVALGVMQTHRSALIPVLPGLAAAAVAALHLIAGWRERALDRGLRPREDGWIAVGPAFGIPDGGARIVAAPGGERIAVFRDGQRLGAITNLCAHQNGPLGEGRIIDGCVTCPWHGFQYRLEDGTAPPPYADKVATYRVRINGGAVEVDPTPLAPGTRVALADLRQPADRSSA